MSFTWTPDPGGFLLAPCLQQLGRQLQEHSYYGPRLSNLGEIGDAQHQAEGTASDHNPFVRHDGHRYVRAIDIGGPHADLLQLQRWFNHHWYADKDDRVFPYGYAKGPDDRITTWFGNGATHRNTGDEGHLHISVNQANGDRPGADGWVPSLDSRAAWSLPEPSKGGNGAKKAHGNGAKHKKAGQNGAEHNGAGATAARTYVVVPGDTLTSIAARYPENFVTANSLATFNHLADPDTILVGQTLRIPGDATAGAATHHPSYRIRTGDTLTSIARHYAWLGATPQSLAQINHIVDPNLIFGGQLLTIG